MKSNDKPNRLKKQEKARKVELISFLTYQKIKILSTLD